jgi:hypothetical protein
MVVIEVLQQNKSNSEEERIATLSLTRTTEPMVSTLRRLWVVSMGHAPFWTGDDSVASVVAQSRSFVESNQTALQILEHHQQNEPLWHKHRQTLLWLGAGKISFFGRLETLAPRLNLCRAGLSFGKQDMVLFVQTLDCCCCCCSSGERVASRRA